MKNTLSCLILIFFFHIHMAKGYEVVHDNDGNFSLLIKTYENLKEKDYMYHSKLQLKDSKKYMILFQKTERERTQKNKSDKELILLIENKFKKNLSDKAPNINNVKQRITIEINKETAYLFIFDIGGEYFPEVAPEKDIIAGRVDFHPPLCVLCFPDGTIPTEIERWDKKRKDDLVKDQYQYRSSFQKKSNEDKQD